MPTVMQWVKHLMAKIDRQAAYAAPFEQRYRNERVLPFLVAEYREVYGAKADQFAQIHPPRTGMAGITIDALTDRLTVIGADSDHAEAARVVERAWEDNDLDVMHREGFRESFIASRSFAQVDVAANDIGGRRRAVIGIESATQVAIHRDTAPPYDARAAVKVMTDEWTGERRARLWLRAGEQGRTGRKIDLIEGREALEDPEGSGAVSRWRVEDDVEGFPFVPVVEFTSRPRLLAEPVSEIEPIDSLIDIVDLVDGLMVFAGHFGAVPIRWAKGLDVPRDPKDPSKPLLGPDGKPMLGFNPRADHLWASTSKDAQFGQLTPAELASFVTWAEHATKRIRAKTQVASTYYNMDLKSHMSAELLKVDEAPMVRRLNSIGRDGAFGQAIRRLDMMILSVERPDLVSAGVRVKGRWADPQTRMETQDADTFSKLVPALGPYHVARNVLGWSPAEAQAAVDEAERLRSQQADPMLGLLGGPMTPAGRGEGDDDAARGDG